MPVVEVTKRDFKKFVAMQISGKFNILDPNARNMTGLSNPVYQAIMNRYLVLCRLYPEVLEEAR